MAGVRITVAIVFIALLATCEGMAVFYIYVPLAFNILFFYCIVDATERFVGVYSKCEPWLRYWDLIVWFQLDPSSL